MALTDVIFRTIAKLGFTTKGSELTWSELDKNFEYIIDVLASVNTGASGNVAPYNAGTTYSNTPPTYVSYSGNIYQYINASPSAGNTPDSSPLYWTLVSAGALVHQQNTDTMLAQGTGDQVTAAEIRNLLDAGVITGDWADLDVLRNADGLKAGRLYLIRDRNIFLQAVSVNQFSRQATWLAQNPNYATTSDFLRESSLQPNDAIWSGVGTYWWNQIITSFPTAPDRIGKMCIYQGKHYVSLTGNNTGAEPPADTTNWQVVADGDASYIYEVETIEYDFAADDVRKRMDRRGNVIGKHNGIGNIPLTRWFQFGNDRVTDNYAVDGYFDISTNRGVFYGNKILSGVGTNITFTNWRGECAANTWMGKGCNGSIVCAETNSVLLTSNTFYDVLSVVATLNFGGYIQGCIFRNIGSVDFSDWVSSSYMNNNVFENFAGTLTLSSIGGATLDNSHFESGFWYQDGAINDSLVIKKDWSNIVTSHFHTPPSLGGSTTLQIPYFASTEVSVLGGGAFDIEEINSTPNMIVRIKPAAGETFTLRYSATQIQSPDGSTDDTFVGSSGHYFIGVKMAGGKFHVLQWFN